MITVDQKTLRLPASEYFAQQHLKNLIVLHFTAGTSSRSAYDTWMRDAGHIGTAYGVDPGGTVYEFFPPEAWAYHLGVKGTSAHDKRSIGIEIANPGPLRLDVTGEWLCWWPRGWQQRWCRLDEHHRYIRASFRGFDYFAAMPAEQQAAVGELVRELCADFQIPLQWTPAVERGEFLGAAMDGYMGIAAHTSFRATDKWDVGPAFDWRNLLPPGKGAALAA